MADMPLRPVRSRIAIKSALDKASAPWAASRSRGRSWIGRSWMRTLAFIGRGPIVTTNGPGSEGKNSRAVRKAASETAALRGAAAFAVRLALHDEGGKFPAQMRRDARLETRLFAAVIAFDDLGGGMEPGDHRGRFVRQAQFHEFADRPQQAAQFRQQLGETRAGLRGHANG